jgi:hypothetical protein
MVKPVGRTASCSVSLVSLPCLSPRRCKILTYILRSVFYRLAFRAECRLRRVRYSIKAKAKGHKSQCTSKEERRIPTGTLRCAIQIYDREIIASHEHSGRNTNQFRREQLHLRSEVARARGKRDTRSRKLGCCKKRFSRFHAKKER